MRGRKAGGSRTAPTKPDIRDIDIAVVRAGVAFVGATHWVALVVARRSPIDTAGRIGNRVWLTDDRGHAGDACVAPTNAMSAWASVN